MTNEELMQMPAGREMDALIATEFMGYAQQGPWFILPFMSVSIDGLPHYSTDIADAWQVVEKLENHPDEILFKITRKGSTFATLKWCATFRCIKGLQHDAYAEADTAPLAICRSALMVERSE